MVKKGLNAMKKIIITTDTASDITLETAEKYGIHLMPINITIDGKSYKDRYDITPEEFYDILPKCNEIPKTSQITVSQHIDEFKKFSDEYTIIHIPISANASGTYQSACLAANEIKDENPDADITVVDPSSFSYGYGYYAIEAAKMANDGKTKEEIISYLEDGFSKTKIFFAPDTLDYLKKGGRISSKAKIIADVLDITPILSIEEGLVMSKDKVRGRKKVMGKIADMVNDAMDKDTDQPFVIMHALDSEKAEKFRDILIEKTGKTNFVIEVLGPTIGIHAGPGAFGVIFRGK